MSEYKNRWEKQARWLTQALILSGALNIGLLLTFYFILRDKYEVGVIDHRPAGADEQIQPIALHRSNVETLFDFRGMPFDQLVNKLRDKQLVEDGYTQRDLALAALVSFFHFNLQKALSGMPVQQRQLILEKNGDPPLSAVTLFAGLSDVHFQSIIHFATTERWPLTSKGIFLQIKHTKDNIDPSLMEAFFLTPEFLEIMTLVSHTKSPLDKYAILTMLREGDWQLLSDFYQSQLATQDLSDARLQQLLLDYIDRQSTVAARLMLSTYNEFAVKKLDDKHVVAILQLLRNKTPESERFAKEILLSPRSDAVLKLAAARLYRFANESLPESYDYIAALMRFIPEEILKEKIKIPKESVDDKPSITATPEVEKSAQSQPAALPTANEKGGTTLPVNQPSHFSPPPAKNAAPVNKSTSRSPTIYPRERYHIVGDGETLWLISKRYNVDIEALKRCNGLESNSIYSGLVLRIPG